MTTSPEITDELFQTFLQCETKFHLKKSGTGASPSEFSDWQKAAFADFKEKCSLDLVSGLRKDEHLSGVSFSQVRESNAHRFVIDCVVAGEGIQSHIHALERIASPGKDTDGVYIPIRFVPSGKITRNDRLLLGFDALAISGSSPTPQYGRIIYGDLQKTTKMQLAGLMPKVRQVIECINKQQVNQVVPSLTLNRHCSECEFHFRCHQTAKEKDDLSLLANLPEAEKKKLNRKGIFTVTQLSYTFRARRRPKRHASKPEKFSHALKALAIREQKTYVVGKPKLKLSGTPVYLDVEGTPDRNFYYLIGVRVKAGDLHTQHSCWADEQADEKEIWNSFLHTLAKIENPQIVHYGSYEKTFLKKMQKRYSEISKPFTFLDELISNSVNPLTAIYAQIYFPTYSNNLKEIAGTLGFRWSEDQASGVSAVVWRSKWETTRDSELKQRLLTYNTEDCEALEILASTVSELCDKVNQDKIQTDGNVIHTDSMKPDDFYCYNRKDYAPPDLKYISKAAYWDYQREKVYARTNKRIRHITRKSYESRAYALPIDQIIQYPPSTCCPKCGSLEIDEHGIRNKVVYDLKFSDTGVNRNIVKYQLHRYSCRQCATVFYPRQRPWMGEKHGPNVIAFIIYQLVELRLTTALATRNLKQLFGLKFCPSEISRQKKLASHLYQDTHNLILKKLADGKLIHADETKVSIKGEGAYVWVFTNMEEVVYLYKDTREGDFLQDLLKNFNGVLVSDFYSAYDSLNCPQQKCLIHLTRDLNDALLSEPYNEELKALTQEFTKLLKTIVETVDQHGLKANYLKKHKPSVAEFYDWLAKQKYITDVAAKTKKRFEKNRNKLFTFLDYDSVPWNNNNAEHAIKAFAALREVLRGNCNESGIREYLTFLSISETCRYKGVNFLDLLRSGEKDIDVYIEKNANEPKVTVLESAEKV